MSESELGRKWDRCLADTVVKIGKGLLASGRPSPEPSSQLEAPLTRRAEREAPREVRRSGLFQTLGPGLVARAWAGGRSHGRRGPRSRGA